ncbi:hypothetical protein OAV88_03775 [bacterium]|nr:hypothetical protein [bacterium]
MESKNEESFEFDGSTYTLRQARLIFEATGAGLGYIKAEDRDYVSYEKCRRCESAHSKSSCAHPCATLKSINELYSKKWNENLKQRLIHQYEMENPRVSIEPTRSVSMIVKLEKDHSCNIFPRGHEAHHHEMDQSPTYV